MNKKIFLIEDDYSIRTTLTELLALEGYEVTPYCHGRAGLDGLSNTSKAQHPRLILLDLMMPVMDGYQFLTEIQKDQDLSDIPIVVLSADGQAPTKLARERVKAFMKKPIDLDPFLSMVGSLAR